MTYENHAGLTITGSKLQLVEIAHKGGQFIVENINEAFFAEYINFESDKDTKISALLQGAFNELAINRTLRTSAVSFSLPFEMFHIVQIPYDNTMLHPDLIEEFKFQFSLLYPFTNINNLILQYIEVEKGPYTEINTVIVFGLQRKYLLLIDRFCKQNNLQLKFIDNIHVASERALSASYPIAEQNLVLSVYFNNKHLSLIYSSLGKPVYFKVIPLTDAGELPVHLEREMKPSGFLKITKNIISSAYLCGEDLSPTLVESVKKVLNINFIHFNPFSNLQPGPDIFKNRHYTDRANSFSPSAGIAIRVS